MKIKNEIWGQGRRANKDAARRSNKTTTVSWVSLLKLLQPSSSAMRRFTRLTNGFSKKIENHAHAVSLHFMHYNFCRVHQTLCVTPAMEIGIADHVWSVEEVVALLDRPSVEQEAA